MSQKAIAPADIVAATARFYQMDPSVLLTGGRTSAVALARHVAMYLCRRLTACSFPELGLAFKRDHSTIVVAVKRIARLILVDSRLAEQVEAIQDSMAEHHLETAYSMLKTVPTTLDLEPLVGGVVDNNVLHAVSDLVEVANDIAQFHPLIQRTQTALTVIAKMRST